MSPVIVVKVVSVKFYSIGVSAVAEVDGVAKVDGAGSVGEVLLSIKESGESDAVSTAVEVFVLLLHEASLTKGLEPDGAVEDVPFVGGPHGAVAGKHVGDGVSTDKSLRGLATHGAAEWGRGVDAMGDEAVVTVVADHVAAVVGLAFLTVFPRDQGGDTLDVQLAVADGTGADGFGSRLPLLTAKPKLDLGEERDLGSRGREWGLLLLLLGLGLSLGDNKGAKLLREDVVWQT